MASGNENARAPNERLLRVKQIIGPGGIIPVSKSTWWAGVKTGRFPKPIKVTPGVTVWRQSDIDDLVASLGRDAGLKHTPIDPSPR
jgi:predicted DNA-binding transcriptional regulator AlpA